MKLKKKSVTGSTFSYSKKFPEIHRPKWADSLKWPDDITQLNAQNVSELHGKYTQLFAFANYELAQINIRLIQLDTEESLRRNAVFRSRPSMNDQERWRRDAIMESDRLIEGISSERGRLRMMRVHVEMFVQNYDRYLTALSRELSRKTHEMHKM